MGAGRMDVFTQDRIKDRFHAVHLNINRSTIQSFSSGETFKLREHDRSHFFQRVHDRLDDPLDKEIKRTLISISNEIKHASEEQIVDFLTTLLNIIESGFVPL